MFPKPYYILHRCPITLLISFYNFLVTIGMEQISKNFIWFLPQ